MKKCKKCGEMLPETEFNFHRRAKDGLMDTCKSCRSGKRKTEPESVSDESNPLASFTPRQLMAELCRRGYSGELTVTQKFDIAKSAR